MARIRIVITVYGDCEIENFAIPGGTEVEDAYQIDDSAAWEFMYQGKIVQICSEYCVVIPQERE